LTEKRGDIGAVVTFTGLVRDTASGRPIVSMELEHYPGMTETELNRVLDAAEARWPITASTIVHRVGALKPGDQIVLVAVASAHRHAAFQAGEFVMDFLKTRAPFWKRETFTDGTGGWVDAREADHAAVERWSQKAEA
jgi:molybdopterin synthase catalytic subunit